MISTYSRPLVRAQPRRGQQEERAKTHTEGMFELMCGFVRHLLEQPDQIGRIHAVLGCQQQRQGERNSSV